VIARLSRTEEVHLIAQAYRMPGVRGLLITTLFQTGTRVSAFVQVQVPEVYFDEQMLLITHAKGGKQRYVPRLPELTHALRTYLRERTTGPLFTTRRHTLYSPRWIQQLVQETAALAGIPKRVHPHLLRHSVATTLLERGMPLEQIQQFLGHARLETTQIYAASTSAMIKESYQKALGR
jgi:integrase/recombinase XerD